jgi:hypothetical protein
MSIWSTLYAITDDGGLEATGLRPVFDGMDDLGGTITVPIALTDADGVVFTDADGVVLTYGTARVRPIEEPE